jgi:hypothetical protein
MEGDKTEGSKDMGAIEEQPRPDPGEHPAVFKLEKGLQIHAGKYPTVYFSLYRLLQKDRTRVVTPDTQLVIEGFPRSGNS